MKIFVKTFGCRVNQVETQAVLEKLAAAGHEFCKGYEEADACIINTCTVTARADSDAARLLRQIFSRNPAARLIVTGCFAQLHADKVLLSAPNAELVPNPKKQDISLLLGAPESAAGWAVTGLRGRTRAFIKIQDGCDRFCSYCAVPLARSVKYSKNFDSALKEVRALLDCGLREIVFSGINIGEYKCPETGLGLAALLTEASRIPGDFRLRFSSVEAFSINEELLDAASRAGEKFCRYFHIPLQTGSPSVATAMNRKCRPDDFRRAVALVRRALPEASIFSDVIAGYPSETEAEFLETEAFIETLALSGLHVFSFSARAGTAAAKLKTLPPAVVRDRSRRLHALDEKLRSAFARSLVGTVQRVLPEEGSRPFSGLSESFQRVLLPKGAPHEGFTLVEIESASGGLCQGRLL